MNYLRKMLATKRPYGSRTEEKFVRAWIDPLGCEVDGFGNRIKRVGDAPILWSCHTDTVHRTEGKQRIAISREGIVSVGKQPKGVPECLGADDAVGVWLMMHMIKAKVPGMYIFHRGEEKGGLGSDYIAYKTPELLAGITHAIAFDRRGTGSIITAQLGGRCASDAFALDLSERLGLGHAPDSTGSFTDTANYVNLIPECSNISSGYLSEHRPEETTSLFYALALKEALLKADFSNLIVERDPTEQEYFYDGYEWACGGDDWWDDACPACDSDKMEVVDETAKWGIKVRTSYCYGCETIWEDRLIDDD